MPEHVSHCLELLGSAGTMRARRMFGGWGLYADDLFIALIADDQLYLKVNAQTQPRFEAAGGEPFVFTAKGKTASMMYFTPPAEAMDSAALMMPWAGLAVQAALAARLSRPPGKKAAKSKVVKQRPF